MWAFDGFFNRCLSDLGHESVRGAAFSVHATVEGWDDEIVATAAAAGVTMYLTGTRHFFH